MVCNYSVLLVNRLCGHTGLKQKLYILQGYIVRVWTEEEEEEGDEFPI